MNIIIKFKNLKITESFRKFIEDKIGGIKRLAKRFSGSHLHGQIDSVEAFVEVEKETLHHHKGDVFKAEAKVNVPGKNFVAKAHGENLKKVVTQVRDELKREIRKYKTKIIELPRRKERRLKNLFKFWQ